MRNLTHSHLLTILISDLSAKDTNIKIQPVYNLAQACSNEMLSSWPLYTTLLLNPAADMYKGSCRCCCSAVPPSRELALLRKEEFITPGPAWCAAQRTQTAKQQKHIKQQTP
jgi:hypothetical protein